MTAVDGSQRFHLTVTAAGRPVVRGWWGSETTARRKFPSWVGEYGSMPGARIILTDEQQGSVLTSWPGEG
ncbi:hypothetical protein ACFC08_37840 [Streptomyces sp. NPDC056112]|uniref:hypothetical protein n=1 Tax=unclassified Streptomyces TaxID=2593676 RepID=UPI001CD24CD0|nr:MULTISPECIES: hypothetical protein [unclassified Streptomyces]